MTLRRATIFDANTAPGQGSDPDSTIIYSVDVLYLLPVPTNKQRPNPFFVSRHLWLDAIILGRSEPVLANKGGYTSEEINALLAGSVIEWLETSGGFTGGTIGAPKNQATRTSEIRAFAIGGDYPDVGIKSRWQQLTDELAARDPNVKAVGTIFTPGAGWTTGW